MYNPKSKTKVNKEPVLATVALSNASQELKAQKAESEKAESEKTMLVPDLRLLHLYEARSMTQLLLDSLTFSYSKESFVRQLNQIQSRLQNVSGNQVVRRIIEQTIRDLPDEKLSAIYQHRQLLSELIAKVQKLTVLNEQISFNNDTKNDKPEQNNDSQSSLDTASNTFLNEIKSLITFRHINKKAQHLIAPEQAFVLKQSLGLKLEVTRFALVEKDKQNYHALINEALDFLNRYFDIKSPEVIAMNQSLLNLLEQPLETQTPVVTKSIQDVLDAIDQLISRLSTEKKDLFSGVNS